MRVGGAGGRWEKSRGTTVGTLREVERMFRDRALSQTVRKSGAVGVMVSSV